MPPAENSLPLTLKEAVLNQYQLILAAGAAGLSLLAGEAWPLFVFAGLECVTLPFLVGNAQIGRLRWLRRKSAEIKAGEGEEGLPVRSRKEELARLAPERRRVFEKLTQLAAQIERSTSRLSAESRPLVEEQHEKLEALLDTALARLVALQSYDELGGQDHRSLDHEIESLRAKAAIEGTPANLRKKYQETLAVKEKLAAALERSVENRAALETELDTLTSALQLLAQESAGLTAPSEVSRRLSELVGEGESTVSTLRELEDLAAESRDLDRLRVSSRQVTRL